MRKALRRKEDLLTLAQPREMHTFNECAFLCPKGIVSQALGWAFLLGGEIWKLNLDSEI